MSFYKYILDQTFTAITTFGSPVFYILVILILLKINVNFAIIVFLSLIFIEIFCGLIKFFFHKERPNPQERTNFFDRIDANSFPSIHSARISFLAIVLSLYYRDAFFTAIGIILMFAVGYSRVYLKRHDYIDVMCGFLIGILTAIISFNIL